MSTQENLLRIGELAKEAGVSVTTVKFYVKEGLIRPACKTGRNMAYYDRACINAIGVIRKLQRERYYPLSVIKRLMASAPVEQVELELLDAIHKVDLPNPDAVSYTHLDVYKRQAYTLEGSCGVRPESAAKTAWTAPPSRVREVCAMALTTQERQKLQDIARELRLTVIDVMAWSGGAHVGGSLSIIDILTILYFKYLDVNPADPQWDERDRFVLSKGCLLYTSRCV